MIVLLLGPTKCGKSTQGKFLEQQYGLPALKFADIFNKAVTEGTLAGQDAQAAVAQGEDVPEIVAVEMIRERIVHPDCADGFSLEGYPISMEQAALLDGMLTRVRTSVNVAICFDVQDNEWTDAMSPMLGWYSASGKLATLNGNMYVEEVQMAVTDILQSAGLSGAAQPPQETMQDTQMSVQAGAAGAASGQMSVDEEAALVKWIDPRRASSSAIGTRTMNYTFGTEHAKCYHSNFRYREDMRRHERVKYDPNQKYELMMTQSMEYGWRAKDPALYIKDPEMFHPRMKSRETAYSEALILGPRHP